MTLIVLAGVAMAVKDFLGTLLVIAEAHRRPVWAGIFDIGMDCCNFLWIKFGLQTNEFGFLMLSLAIGSFIATMLGVVLGHRFMPDQSAIPAGPYSATPRVEEPPHRRHGLRSRWPFDLPAFGRKAMNQ